jgi:hypothetical protein
MTGTASVLRQAALTMATAGAVALIAAQAHAIAVGVLSSSYTITHNSGFGTPEITDSFGPAAIPAWPPAIQYNQTLVDGNNSSGGAGGAATFVSPFVAGLGFPVGTGVSQDWVDAPAHTAAELIVDFTVTYDIVDGFGPPTSAFANFLLGGNVSNGGWVRFSYNASFTGNPGGLLGGALSGTYFNNTPGAFAVYLSEIISNNNGVPDDGTIGLVGQIKFEAYDGFNHDSSGIDLTRTEGIVPTPLPAALPMMAAAVGALALIRRRSVNRN